MSIVTGRNGLKISIPDGNTSGEIPGYTRVVNPDQTLTKTVDGSTLSVDCVGCLAGSVKRVAWNGINYVNATDHGQGYQWTSNVIHSSLFPMDGNNFSTLSGFQYSFVEQGNVTDGSNLNACSSDCLETWVRNDNQAIITTVNPAFWGDAADTVNPTPRSTRRLSNWIGRVERIIGYGGNDHIIQNILTLTTPNLAELVDYPEALHCGITALLVGANFSVLESIDLGTGGATDVTPPSDGTLVSSQTKPMLWRNAGGTNAAAVYTPLSEVGTYGFFGGRKSTNANTFQFRGAALEAPGTYVRREFFCYGSKAQAIAALQQVYADFP